AAVNHIFAVCSFKTESLAWDREHDIICSCHPKNCSEQEPNRDSLVGGEDKWTQESRLDDDWQAWFSTLA
ncbi:MAG: hypothetical protein P8O70_04695, partial [SAR324 cluster bacterium]|nr:hypothetical protein [SAR324 cluster bacterium]